MVRPACRPGAALLPSHGQIRHVLVPRWSAQLLLHLPRTLLLHHPGFECFPHGQCPILLIIGTYAVKTIQDKAVLNRDEGWCVVKAGEYDEKRIQADCRKRFGISGDADWSVISLGGMDFSAASNIVFSNGEYDPWKIGGLSCMSVPSAPMRVLILRSHQRAFKHVWHVPCLPCVVGADVKA